MSPAEHVLSELHQVGDRVLPIPDELVQLRRDQGGRFRLVELETSSEPLLGDAADLEAESRARRRERGGARGSEGGEIKGNGALSERGSADERDLETQRRDGPGEGESCRDLEAGASSLLNELDGLGREEELGADGLVLRRLSIDDG